ncbi:tubulin tyrosine ligase-related [Schistosoma mansoni]|uniref:tubulin tyrosine ligase-related n=1 Tax=Schistosoma mansoni TaxID=6183 RepID=UPI0001A6283C|nr:tubulin tyrosine ligase-related [Schistosoma mansoni]|eukprot:XP_018651866.1 tubulin tyrosine ligase-related [Schistosoma mansoni]
MRILFRKKLTPLVTNFQVNVNNSCESYDVKTSDNLENTKSCKVEYTNSTEKDIVSDDNSPSHLLPIHNNEKNNLIKGKNDENKLNEDLSCLTEPNLYEKENASNHFNNESLINTTKCLNEPKLKRHENYSLETVEKINKIISDKREFIKEVSQTHDSKLFNFPIIKNNENRLLRRIKTERHCNNVQFNIIEKNCQLSTERLKIAKDEVDEAIKSRKIFSILGPYNRIRKALRTRGWIEKFDVNIGPPGQTTQESKKTIRSITNVKTVRNSNSSSNDTTLEDSEDGDSDDDVNAVNEEKQRVQPWEEDNGYYGLLSRMVRSELPRFIWSLRKNQVDFHNLQKDQIINHHSGAPFTTKVGLCKQLRQIRWFADCNADYFFPRCFIISEEEDRQSFINDFRLTACLSIVKMIANLISDVNQLDSFVVRSNPEIVYDMNNVGETNENVNATKNSNVLEIEGSPNIDLSRENSLSFLNNTISYKKVWNINLAPSDLLNSFEIPDEIIEFSIFQCQEFLKTKYHEDLDKSTKHLSSHCQYLCKLLKKYCPQFDMDGVRNVWIVKPGAKSRGRGIVCHDRLDNILKIVQGSVFLTESRYIVQKYIERPLLIYKTKFDIRQWFLITDWAPLTVWWYQDCYLRFCSQEFTLNDFSESIHLCNNCIQHKYKNGPRSSKLPDENMWTWEQFQTWLTEQGQPNLWTEKIQPAMKNAVLNVLLSSQESIEPRKNCFGLYGADFLLTDNDYRIWLIEINSSPCMSPSTSVTAVYTASVLEDTLKVVLDKKYNRNSDVGRFELLYRQPFHNPSTMYTGMELYVIGSKISKPQLENTTVLRCFNKATLDFNGQSLPNPEVKVMSTIGRDKKNMSPIVLRQTKSQTRKEIKPSNTGDEYERTTEIAKGMNGLLPPMKCGKFPTDNQSTMNINIDNPVKHLQSVKETRKSSRSKSCKYENELKICNVSTVLKSVKNIRYLTGLESSVCLSKYNDDISHDDNLLKSSRSESYLKSSLEELDKSRPLINCPGISSVKDSSTSNLNQSKLRLMNKGELNQYTEYETYNNTNLYSSHQSIHGKNKNSQSSSLLLPKIYKNQNSESNIKLSTLIVDQLDTNYIRKIPTYKNYIDKIKLNIIQFNEGDSHLKHIHHEKSNHNKLYKHIQKRCIILRRMKKIRKSPAIRRKSLTCQSQSKLSKVLIVNQRLADTTMKDNSLMNLNEVYNCRKLKDSSDKNTNNDKNTDSILNNLNASHYDVAINSSDSITLDSNDPNEISKIITSSPKSSLKQSSTDSGFDDEISTQSKTFLPLDNLSSVTINRNNSYDKAISNGISLCSFINSSKMFVNCRNTDDTKFHRYNINDKFNLKFLSRIAND